MSSPERLLLATGFVGRDGGVGVYLIRLVEALRTSGYDVRLIAGGHDDDVDDVIIVPGVQEDRWSSETYASFAAQLEDFSPDIVHVHHLNDEGIVDVIRGQAPLVWGVHDYMVCPTGNLYFEPGHVCTRAHGPGCIPHIMFHGCAHMRDPRPLPSLYRASARNLRILRSTDVALAFSRFVAGNLERNKIPGVQLAPYIASSTPRPAYEPSGRPRLLFVGRLSASKGLDVLLTSLARVDAELEVCGDGWYMRKARELAERLGVRPRVVFHGWLTESELSAAYDRCDVLVVPSLWPEPFGIVGIEAMSHGRAVVGSATGGIPEWLSHGRTGLLVPPGDAAALASALSSLISDPTEVAVMGRRGRERALNEFSPKAHVDALTRVHQVARLRWNVARDRERSVRRDSVAVRPQH